MVLLFGASFASSVYAQEKQEKKTCVTVECHIEYGQKEYVHGPVGLGDCESCHELVGEYTDEKHTYKLAREGENLCSFCHLEQTLEKYVHEPLATGECSGCHDPHSSDYQFLIPTPTVSEMCFECHEMVTEGMAFLHGPLAAGECTVCHNSHSSDYTGLLVVDKEFFCINCHEITNEELKRFDFVHQPVVEGCTECHGHHGGDNPMILKESVPELCYPCHEHVNIQSHASLHQHDVVLEYDGCVQCHTPHASNVRFGLKSDPLSLCLSCHNEDVEVREGDIIPAFNTRIEGMKYLHGPVAERDCESCHVSHGSDHFRLLIQSYPSGFYVPFNLSNYQLCFSCHLESKVLTEETSELTEFRNGTLNLHYKHVNKPERGRSCGACHATHGSNNPRHISEEVLYGSWLMPIIFKKTDTGGSCQTGCHQVKEYDRIKPVIYTK